MSTPTLTQTAPTDAVVVPASFALLPMLTVEENVVLPLRLAGLRADPAWIRGGAADGRADGRRGQAGPADLSRGEQLRVALARALATRPATLMVADLAGTVDSDRRWRGAIRTLRRIADELDLTVVLATARRGRRRAPRPHPRRCGARSRTVGYPTAMPEVPTWGYPNSRHLPPVWASGPRRAKLREP